MWTWRETETQWRINWRHARAFHDFPELSRVWSCEIEWNVMTCQALHMGPGKSSVLFSIFLFFSSIFKWKRAKDSRKCESWHMPRWALKSSGEIPFEPLDKKERKERISELLLWPARAPWEMTRMFTIALDTISLVLLRFTMRNRSHCRVFIAPSAGLVKMNRFVNR